MWLEFIVITVLRDRFRAGHEAHTPAGHAVGLGQRIHEDHAITQLGPRHHEVVVAHAIEHHAVVDIVGDDPAVRIFHQHIGQRGDLVLRIDHPGRIDGLLNRKTRVLSVWTRRLNLI